MSSLRKQQSVQQQQQQQPPQQQQQQLSNKLSSNSGGTLDNLSIASSSTLSSSNSSLKSNSSTNLSKANLTLSINSNAASLNLSKKQSINNLNLTTTTLNTTDPTATTTTVMPLQVSNQLTTNTSLSTQATATAIATSNITSTSQNSNFVLPSLNIIQPPQRHSSSTLLSSAGTNTTNTATNTTNTNTNNTNAPLNLGKTNSSGYSNSISLMNQNINTKDIRNKLNDFKAILDSENSQLRLNLESPFSLNTSNNSSNTNNTNNNTNSTNVRPSVLTPLNFTALTADNKNSSSTPSLTPRNRREMLKPFNFQTPTDLTTPNQQQQQQQQQSQQQQRPNQLNSSNKLNSLDKVIFSLPIGAAQCIGNSSNNDNTNSNEMSGSNNYLYPFQTLSSRSSSSSSIFSSSSSLAPPASSSSSSNSHTMRSRLEEVNSNKFKEIMMNAGFLLIDKERIKTTMDDLTQVCELGSGTCGHVIKMKHNQTGYIMAVKQMSVSGIVEENKRIIMDLDVVLKSHDCSDIVKCLGYFISESDVWICMELMSMCFDKLLKLIKKPIPEPILGKLTVSTLNALNYLKENHNVIHRDIKPSNILIDANGNIKLCDFGISGNLINSNAKSRNNAGCAGYMAPERIDPIDPSNPVYDIRADVWSLGITLVELATGQYPYRHCHNEFEVMSTILQCDAPKLEGDQFSENFKSFVGKCLIKDVRKRPKYNILLQDPFVLHYKQTDVDVKSWFRKVTQQSSSSSTASSDESLTPSSNESNPNSNSLNREDLSSENEEASTTPTAANSAASASIASMA